MGLMACVNSIDPQGAVPGIFWYVPKTSGFTLFAHTKLKVQRFKGTEIPVPSAAGLNRPQWSPIFVLGIAERPEYHHAAQRDSEVSLLSSVASIDSKPCKITSRNVRTLWAPLTAGVMREL